VTVGSYRVSVDVATVWTTPDAPRHGDAPALADEPDLAAWARDLDRAAGLDLHGRTETQLLRGEPVEVVEESPTGWVRVVAPWQPSPKNPRGYPGWVRRAHLTAATASSPYSSPPALIEADPLVIAGFARGFLGRPYLWGGLSRFGLDCSGLVHLSYRQAGAVVPRDADAQCAVAGPVELGQERPGDLYFFARDDGLVFHVGIATGRLRMLHAPEVGGVVEDAPLAAERRDTLVGAGRLLPSASP